jgi:hypothetical protein
MGSVLMYGCDWTATTEGVGVAKIVGIAEGIVEGIADAIGVGWKTHPASNKKQANKAKTENLDSSEGAMIRFLQNAF